MNRLADRFYAPHPFACRVWGCRWPVQWLDDSKDHVGVGWCGDHVHIVKDAWRCTPVTIYGREGEGWLSWPMDMRVRVQIEMVERDLAHRAEGHREDAWSV